MVERSNTVRADFKSVARRVQGHEFRESCMLSYVQRRLEILSDQVAQEREAKKIALASGNDRSYLRYQAALTRFTSIFQVPVRIHGGKNNTQAKTFNELKRLLLFLVDRENFPELNELDSKQSRVMREAQSWLCQSFPNLGSKEVWSQFLPDFFYQSERAIFRLQTADVREGYHVVCHVFAKVNMLLKSQPYCQEVLRLISSQSQNQQVNEAFEAPVSHEDFPLKDILSMFGLLKETIEQAMELLNIYETSYYAISEKKHLEEKKQAYTCKMEINRKTKESMVYLHQLANFMLSKGVDQKTLQSSFQTVKDFYLVFYNQECPPVKDISLQLSIITNSLKPIQALNQAAGVWTRTGDIASDVFSSMLGCEKENLSQADAQEIIKREKECLSDYLIGSGGGSVGEEFNGVRVNRYGS